MANLFQTQIKLKPQDNTAIATEPWHHRAGDPPWLVGAKMNSGLTKKSYKVGEEQFKNLGE